MPKAKQDETRPSRAKLEDAARLVDGSEFLGWSKLAHEPIMMGRFADGTVVYRRHNKAWAFGKPSEA